MKRLTVVLLLLLSVCMSGLLSCAEQPEDAVIPYENELNYTLDTAEGVMNLVMFRVGCANAVLLSTQNHKLLIGTGEKDDDDAQKILTYLESQKIDTLDAVIVPNIRTDSTGGLETILKNISVSAVIEPSYNATGHRYTKFLRTVVSSGAELYSVTEACELSYDDLVIRFLPAKNPTVYDTEEDMSLVLSLTHGNNTFLLPFDIGPRRIAELMAEETEPYTVLMLPDHGAAFDGMEAFLRQYAPKQVLISDSFLHETSYDVLSLLAELKLPYSRTKDGFVCIRSNGKTLKIVLK